MPRDFDLDFWPLYPRKAAKQAARKAWEKAKKAKVLPPMDRIREALEWQKKSRQWQDPALIPHPATWINRGQWDDEPETQMELQAPTDDAPRGRTWRDHPDFEQIRAEAAEREQNPWWLNLEGK